MGPGGPNPNCNRIVQGPGLFQKVKCYNPDWVILDSKIDQMKCDSDPDLIQVVYGSDHVQEV